MSLIELKPQDTITTVYTTYPSYFFRITNGVSNPVFLFNPSSSVGRSRTYEDISGLPMTGNFQITGNVAFYKNSELVNTDKRAVKRIKEIYTANAFLKPQNYNSSSIFSNSSIDSQVMSVVVIPHLVFGREIKPGSLNFNTLSSSGEVRQYYDDSYGGLYTGSVLVGSVFYQHGFLLLGQSVDSTETSQVDLWFSGTNKIPVSVYLCRAPHSSLNFSNNPSFVQYSTSSNAYEISTKQPKTFITGIGLYDENYRLVGVAKVSSPMLNDEQTSILFKLRLNF